ncbi:DUF6571 family protein [Streptomyces pratensis]|uniref:DUF6571 family protein n=1 Tax=Streptomyces pratensis TaxID=1169025 RepID=UPI00301A0DBF
MPTYHEITHTRLSALATAADGWKEMARKFKILEDIYERDVQSISKKGVWVGESATVSTVKFSVTRKEYDSAQKQALAMESLLRDAHAQLVDLVGRVTSAVAEAEGAGMKVSAHGVAVYDFSRTDAQMKIAVQHDPELAHVEDSYTKKISDAVKAVTEYDQDIKVALISASGADQGGLFGFNPKPVNDVEAVEALNLTERVRSGEASERELRRYRDVMRANAEDEHFAQAYINALGGRGTLALADQMHLAAHERGVSQQEQKFYPSITASLADTVASGTKDANGYAYRSFVEGLKSAGTENLGSNTRPVNGYPILVTLMQQGDGYGKEFLNDVGNGIIDAEKGKTEPWLHHVDPSRPDLAVDPLDGVLQVMSKDPEAATYFLDPEAEANRNDHLEYLLTQREDWPDEYFSGPGRITEFENPGKAMGLGAALQAATTGHAPGEKLGEAGLHTEGQARVMHSAIRFLDTEMKGDEFPEHLENLRQPMAKAMADYVPDTHIILKGQESAYGGSGGLDSIGGSGDESHIAVGQGSLVRVMRGVSDDAGSYALLVEAERAYAADVLAGMSTDMEDPDTAKVWSNRSHDIGAAVGALNGIGADVYKDKKDDKAEWAADTAEYAAIGGNGLIGEIPVVGTVGGALIDSIKYDWAKDVVEAADEQGKQDSSENYTQGADGMNQLMGKWGERGNERETEDFDAAQNSAMDGYVGGRAAAAAHL